MASVLFLILILCLKTEILCGTSDNGTTLNAEYTYGSHKIGSSDATIACLNDEYWFNQTTRMVNITCELNDDLISASYVNLPDKCTCKRRIYCNILQYKVL